MNMEEGKNASDRELFSELFIARWCHGNWSRVNNVRSSEHDLTRAVLIFREHEQQKPSIVFRFFQIRWAAIDRSMDSVWLRCHASVTEVNSEQQYNTLNNILIRRFYGWFILYKYDRPSIDRSANFVWLHCYAIMRAHQVNNEHWLLTQVSKG